MKIDEFLTQYFQGEKIEALVFILPIGLLSLVFGAWLFSDRPDEFAKGVAIPFLLMGMVMTLVGGVVGYRTPSQVEKLQAAISNDPEPAQKAELLRMDSVNRAWPKYLYAWAAFGVIGLVLRFLLKSDFSQGLGIALVFFSGIGLLVDGFAERRARPYTEALHTLTAKKQDNP